MENSKDEELYSLLSYVYKLIENWENSMGFLERIRSISIYGMGLMGTSLAYALKTSQNFKGKIYGYVKSERSKIWIEENTLVDKAFLSEDKEGIEYLLNSDMILIGLPVLEAMEFIKNLSKWQYTGLISDMCSTRWELESLVRDLEKISKIRFIGSHPICGSEESGPQYYVPDLYKNKLCIIINKIQNHIETDRHIEDLQLVTNFWKELGMEIVYMDAESHDFILSYLSHSPHIISSILATIIGKKEIILKLNQKSSLPILGGGLRDMIRIAGSNPKMWYDIIKTNKKNIIISLKDFKKELETVIHNIENNFEDWWFDWQSLAKDYKNIIYGNSKSEKD
ncbi:MAG: prephenate dehydrogenase [Leptonema sp. (in: bacteria)]